MNTMGANIRKLRKERNITQEELAEYMGISASAVSQWESGKNAPDISALPILSNIFKVSIDTLFGAGTENADERIESICHDAHYNHFDKGQWDTGIELLRQGLKEFPNSCKIMTHLGEALYVYSCSHGTEKERQKNRLDAIKLLEKVLASCTDAAVRRDAVDSLTWLYTDTGRTEDAIQLTESLAEGYRYMVQSFIYQRTGDTGKYESAQKQAIREFLTTAAFAIHDMAFFKVNGAYRYSWEDRLTLHEKSRDILAILFEDENYLFYSDQAAMVEKSLAYLYAEKKDEANTLLHLEKMAELAVCDAAYDENAQYTSLIMSGEHTTGIFAHEQDNTAKRLLERVTPDPDFDFIRDTDSFHAVSAKLKTYAV